MNMSRPMTSVTSPEPVDHVGHRIKKAGEQAQPSFVWKKYECWFPVGGQDAHSLMSTAFKPFCLTQACRRRDQNERLLWKLFSLPSVLTKLVGTHSYKTRIADTGVNPSMLENGKGVGIAHS